MGYRITRFPTVKHINFKHLLSKQILFTFHLFVISTTSAVTAPGGSYRCGALFNLLLSSILSFLSYSTFLLTYTSSGQNPLLFLNPFHLLINTTSICYWEEKGLKTVLAPPLSNISVTSPRCHPITATKKNPSPGFPATTHWQIIFVSCTSSFLPVVPNDEPSPPWPHISTFGTHRLRYQCYYCDYPHLRFFTRIPNELRPITTANHVSIWPSSFYVALTALIQHRYFFSLEGNIYLTDNVQVTSYTLLGGTKWSNMEVTEEI